MVSDSTTQPKIIKAASACVWRNGAVLLARRGKTLGKGLWSLPGGKLLPGETALLAAHRELQEETGVAAELTENLGEFSIDAGPVTFLITCFAGQLVAGEAAPASDCDAVAWVTPEMLDKYPLAQHTGTAIARAWQLLKL